MKMKFRLKAKLLLSILLSTALIFVLSIGFIGTKLQKLSFNSAQRYIDTYAAEKAMEVRSELNKEMDVTRTIAQGFGNFKSLSFSEMKKFHGDVLKEILKQNEDFNSTWIQWDYKLLDPEWKREGGRIRFIYYRENDLLKEQIDIIDTSLTYERTPFYDIRLNPKEVVLSPYFDTYDGTTQVFTTSVVTPVLYNGEHYAQAGIDINLNRFQDLINEIKPFDDGFSVLISHNGSLVTHPDFNNVGKSYYSVFNNLDTTLINKKKIEAGEPLSFIYKENNKEYYYSYAPFFIGNSETPWYINIVVPIENVLTEARKTYSLTIYSGFFGFLVLAIIIWLIASSITRPLTKTTEVISALSSGEINLSNKINVKGRDEIGDIGISVNKLMEGLNKTSEFATEIGEGNLTADFNLLSDKDTLGMALLEMRKSLELAQEQEEIRKEEERKLNWTNEGLAKFSDLLRTEIDSIEEFSYLVISHLVKYVNANQGGLFILNDDDHNDIYIQLSACYAYNKRKFMDKRIEVGTGLIGRCVREAEVIYMTDIPKDYIHIQSGLGDENPTCLIIVPLKLNDEVFGVIEMASFEVIKDYQIKFIERIGESIASTFSALKVNVRTRRLLEETRQQSEELASQEEEMRQNMEELQATQEEAARKSAEMESLLNALNSSSYVAEYDVNGYLTYINQAYLSLLRKTRETLIGTHHTDYLELSKEQVKNYRLFWSNITSGKIQKQKTKIKFHGKTYTFMETYTPIYNEDSEIHKVLKIANDISEFIDKE